MRIESLLKSIGHNFPKSIPHFKLFCVGNLFLCQLIKNLFESTFNHVVKNKL